MLHIGCTTAREQGFPAAHPIIHKRRLHAEQGAVVGRVRALVAPQAGGGAAAADRVRSGGARVPPQR